MGASVSQEWPLTWTRSLPQNQHGICFKSEKEWLKEPRIQHKKLQETPGETKDT